MASENSIVFEIGDFQGMDVSVPAEFYGKLKKWEDQKVTEIPIAKRWECAKMLELYQKKRLVLRPQTNHDAAQREMLLKAYRENTLPDYVKVLKYKN